MYAALEGAVLHAPSCDDGWIKLVLQYRVPTDVRMSLKITVPWEKKTSKLSPRALSFPGSTPMDHLGY